MATIFGIVVDREKSRTAPCMQPAASECEKLKEVVFPYSNLLVPL
jgi:hypothetical protein